MTISLLRNCLHGSSTAIYVKEGCPKIIFKTTVTEDGVSDLLREHEGIKWYGSRRAGMPILASQFFSKHQSYARLEVTHINAKSVKPTSGLRRNIILLERIIRHYAFVWPKSGCADGKFPIHGDLSLENILFDDRDIYFIDWEHFSVASAPWGFDIIYLLFETYWFSRQRLLCAHKDELLFVSRLIRILQSLGPLDERLVKRPLGTVVNFIKNNDDLWGHQLKKYPMKLPILTMSRSDINNIDELIASNIKRDINEKIISSRMA